MIEYAELKGLWWTAAGGGLLIGFALGSLVTIAVLHFIAKRQSKE